MFVSEKKNSIPENTYECDVNPKGLISKTSQKKADGSLINTINYEYNLDIYMIKKETIPVIGSVFKREIEYLNGNAVKAKSYSNGVQTTTLEYVYYLAKN